MKPYIVGFIFARGGSKGVPRKNIRLLAGKPLIAHAIETARQSKLIDRVVVSTDDDEIASVARQYGAEVPFMRPPELASDESPEWLSWQHALGTIEAKEDGRKIDVFVAVPTTSPLRLVEDIDRCISTLLDSDADLVVTVRPAERNPYFNMVALDERGYARIMIQPDGTIHRRQNAPAAFDMTTVAYAARPAFVQRAKAAFEGKVKAVVVPIERSIDIDSEFDFKIAEFLIGQRSSEESKCSPANH